MQVPEQTALRGVWIYGEPGAGKTRHVHESHPIEQLYIKMANKWWDGYNG